MKRKEVDVKISGVATDSGGGGMLESFATALTGLGLVNEDVCFVSPCSLHSLQLIFATPVEKAFGLGGIHLQNGLQLLHSMHNLEKHFGRAVWKKLFEDK